jgi:hypothetical protein
MKKIPTYKLNIEPMTVEAKGAMGFKHASLEIGKRSKIGGDADFIQDHVKPYCPSCKKEMTFYAQIDSIGDEIVLADCGMVYVFICFDCCETKSIIQSS